MIQDLGSLHFENSYHNVRPTADDRIISMSGGQILLGGEKQAIVIEEDELAMAKWVTPEEIFETPDDFSLTNEMLCKFKEEGKRNPKIIETVRGAGNCLNR